MRLEYDKNCKITNTGTEVEVEAEVAHFRPQDGLTVIVATNKIVLKYNSKHDIYIGKSMGMEFTSKGPKYYETKQGRR